MTINELQAKQFAQLNQLANKHEKELNALNEKHKNELFSQGKSEELVNRQTKERAQFEVRQKTEKTALYEDQGKEYEILVTKIQQKKREEEHLERGRQTIKEHEDLDQKYADMNKVPLEEQQIELEKNEREEQKRQRIKDKLKAKFDHMLNKDKNKDRED